MPRKFMSFLGIFQVNVAEKDFFFLKKIPQKRKEAKKIEDVAGMLIDFYGKNALFSWIPHFSESGCFFL